MQKNTKGLNGKTAGSAYEVIQLLFALQMIQIHSPVDVRTCGTMMIACTIPATAAEPKSEQGSQSWMQQGLALGRVLGPRTQLCSLQHAAEEKCAQLLGPLSVRAPSPESGLPSGHLHSWMLALLSVCACGHGPILQLEAVHSQALAVQSVCVWRHVFVHAALLGGSWLLV